MFVLFFSQPKFQCCNYAKSDAREKFNTLKFLKYETARKIYFGFTELDVFSKI